MKRTFQVLVLVALCVLTGSIYAQKSVKLGHFNSSELMKRMPEGPSKNKFIGGFLLWKFQMLEFLKLKGEGQFWLMQMLF